MRSRELAATAWGGFLASVSPWSSGTPTLSSFILTQCLTASQLLLRCWNKHRVLCWLPPVPGRE